MKSMQQRILGGLWGAIVGDALGVPVEFTPRIARRHDPVAGMRGYGTHGQPAGTWSDDSSLLLCTVETLREKYQPERLAGRFIAWQQWGYWTPYGTVFDIGLATHTALSHIQNGVAPEEAGGMGERDNGNGSLMRILPVALRYADAPIEDLLSMAHRISALTHRHPRSQMACGLYCCMIRGLLEGLTPQEAYRNLITHGQRLYEVLPFHAESLHFARVLTGALADLPESAIISDGYVVHTLEASLWCLLTTTSFEEAVLLAVNLGDDTDTTGCVTGGLAGVYYGLPAIPSGWISQLARRDDIEQLLADFLERTIREMQQAE